MRPASQFRALFSRILLLYDIVVLVKNDAVHEE
jgi:hypothetical protein